MVKIAIVEDDELYSSRLHQYLEKYSAEKNVEINIRIYKSGEEMIGEGYKAAVTYWRPVNMPFPYVRIPTRWTGYMALNQTNGAAEHNVYAYIKHFALNDQEINRTSMLLTFSSEQAIREIYLKPFEIATKGFEGTSHAAMSSFNWIGTVPSCANSNLLNNALRGEWGFIGMVESDYDGSYGYMITDHCIRNGNDLMLGFASAESNILSDQSATAIHAMRQVCKNILYTVGNSGYYTVDEDPAGIMANITKIFITADVIVALIIIAIEAVLIIRYRKKKMAETA
ncbi:MAG: hypothetical protein HFH15_15125 [Ruminococcus sp.]|jgi:beta-glucosidase|nr:hypothetical protein [Ruminococcus sp.]